MRAPVLFVIVVAAGAAPVGCGTDKRLPPLSGSTGGAVGRTGGTVGSTGGAVGSTGGAVGSTGGAVGSTGGAGGGTPGGGAGGTGEVPVDGGRCANPGLSSVNPWRLVVPDAGAPAPALDGGGSGCQGTGSGYFWTGTCSGGAWLRPGGGSPTLDWDDGSGLVWTAASWQQPIAPPAAAAAETRVWASLVRDVRVLCLVCGAIATETVEIRDSAGGKLLFLAKNGQNAAEPTGDQLTALFGVDAHTRAICTTSDRDGCTAVRRTINDHVVDTLPPQTIPPSVRTDVTVPGGTIQVIWDSSSEQSLGRSRGAPTAFPRGRRWGSSAPACDRQVRSSASPCVETRADGGAGWTPHR